MNFKPGQLVKALGKASSSLIAVARRLPAPASRDKMARRQTDHTTLDSDSPSITTVDLRAQVISNWRCGFPQPDRRFVRLVLFAGRARTGEVNLFTIAAALARPASDGGHRVPPFVFTFLDIMGFRPGRRLDQHIREVKDISFWP